METSLLPEPFFLHPLFIFLLIFAGLFLIAFLLLWRKLAQITLLQQLSQQENGAESFNNQLSQWGRAQEKAFDKFQQQLQYSHQHQVKQLGEVKVYFEQQIADLRIKLLRQISEQNSKQEYSNRQFFQELSQGLNEQKEQFNHNQLKAVDQLIEHLTKTTRENREELSKTLASSSEQMSVKMNELTGATDKRLADISVQVEKRLSDGFDKTTKTFNDILQRLALIDDAQKKITELSTNVVSLQEVLADKRSRGAFGEVQLNALIRNVLPEQHFSLQHTLSNGKIADCVLFLPPPTGDVVIDSKFPLESYRKMMDNELAELERKAAERQFKADIKKHINDISDKYLIDRETSDGAIMFIPAEAIFAEIHAHQSELVEFANKKRVWLASPTTLMAILTTVRSVLKDEATRQQIHLIQQHLSMLSQDFGRFKGRFANLAKHIDQAASDVKQIHTSADKITNRFEKIERVDLQEGQHESSLELAPGQSLAHKS
ncbi:DNA recombination protein RmuC [Thalassomonas actiniarum]|uniref:DNA recombination protein RmuC n=1 Tax=Thalassomonas actiniarum TaxID=485447 RepID=A0AAE9YVG9_9GAMM|nr:DNA recombination protein RmuC [Thalassomonas actiniarum]WDE01074.1 DNA recombination protein RmuC [Thalassomonas actiniarum]